MSRRLTFLAVLVLCVSACGGGSQTDENMGLPMSTGMGTGRGTGMSGEMTEAEARASLMATPMPGTSAPPLTGRGADGPILPCTGLDGAVAGAPAAAGGRALPDLTFDCLGGGQAVSLQDLRGPLVLNVWASWCLPCRAELPFLAAAHESLGERVRFAGIALTDSDAPAREWLSFHGVDWPSLADRKGSIRGPLRVPGPPVTLFVNSGGRIAGVHYGAFTSARQVQDAVAEHLQVS